MAFEPLISDELVIKVRCQEESVLTEQPHLFLDITIFFFQAVKLTNMILGDVLIDEVDSTDVVSLAFKELYVQ